MSRIRTSEQPPSRALPLAGLLVALVLTSALPAWAGAVSARPDQPVTACAGDAADTPEPGRC
ncbi:hypothetical protein [Blastococcus sp. TF02A-26]|uniref:hypothetical protein n=1 Tax=Blastococcus sp. TF02A-26 TaxID=2250577 RepID=UPI000DEBA5E8|nr:hypothetical protein [Blastococcus sp. TF02A-26]RBY86934.1 hypothetical protein DQ240_09070 [Blastococcus sp. TF02A-26]